MNYKDVRIVFMGTPAFAVASLNELVEAGCNIVGVITAPDKPAGRGMELQQSEVKKYSIEKGYSAKDVNPRIKINYEGTSDYGLLWFSRPLSAKLRNKSIKLADMLNYPIQEQPIFQDIDNTIPLISDETGEQVVKYIISNPEGGSRVKVKMPVAPAKSNVASVSDVW
jgi:hypothetical protein